MAKLADGNCWMIENLRLENTAAHNSDGALAQGYGTSATYGNFSGLADPEAITLFADNATANSLYSIDGSNNTINIGSSGNASYRIPRYNNINTPVNATDRPSEPTTSDATNSTSNAGIYSYGNYYTWAAAVADTTAYSSGDHNTTSICPAGWHIPTGYTSGEFYKLNTFVNSDATDTTASRKLKAYPNNFVYSGAISNDGIVYRGYGAYYWSSTVNYNYAFYLNIFTDEVYPGTRLFDKYCGWTIRCLTSSS